MITPWTGQVPTFTIDIYLDVLLEMVDVILSSTRGWAVRDHPTNGSCLI